MKWRNNTLCLVLLTAFHLSFCGQVNGKHAQKEPYKILSKIKEDDSIISVVQQGIVKFLLYDTTIIGAEFDDPSFRKQAAFPGFAIMQCSVYLDRDINHAIQIGLGIGTVPTFLRGNGIRTDVVEISRGVVKQAADHFLYEWCEEPKECQNGNTFIKDGLNFLKEIPSSSVYDLFLIDVYTGWNPMAFFTQEIIQNIKTNWLKEKGVFGMNFVGYHNGPHTLVMHSIYKTLLTVFPFVKAFREVEDSTDLEACNVVFFGSNEKFTFNTPQTNEYTHADRNTYFYVVHNFQKWEVFSDLLEDEEQEIEISIHQQLDDEEVTFKREEKKKQARILKEEQEYEDFKQTHAVTKQHMQERVFERFPDQLWEEIKDFD